MFSSIIKYLIFCNDTKTQETVSSFFVLQPYITTPYSIGNSDTEKISEQQLFYHISLTFSINFSYLENRTEIRSFSHSGSHYNFNISLRKYYKKDYWQQAFFCQISLAPEEINLPRIGELKNGYSLKVTPYANYEDVLKPCSEHIISIESWHLTQKPTKQQFKEATGKFFSFMGKNQWDDMSKLAFKFTITITEVYGGKKRKYFVFHTNMFRFYVLEKNDDLRLLDVDENEYFL
ncbi:hypothetical protein CDIK_2596 [Cucumispora dikerogammari]|nr:hypothetical protein CDIK_2596 [Cucumispora dikerogammari]